MTELTLQQIRDLLDGKAIDVGGQEIKAAPEALNEPAWNRATNDEPTPGLFRKFAIFRRHGVPKPWARYFVLDFTGDPWATEAALAYAAAAERDGLKQLADELRSAIVEGKESIGV